MKFWISNRSQKDKVFEKTDFRKLDFRVDARDDSPFEALKFVLLFFKHVGIAIRKDERRRNLAMLLAFHACLCLAVCREAACALETFGSRSIIRLLSPLNNLLIWVFTFRRRDAITEVLVKLERLQLRMEAPNKPACNLFARISTVMVMFMFIIVFACTSLEAYHLGGVKLPECHVLYLTRLVSSSGVFARGVVHFFSRLPVWTLPQMVAVLYVSLCLQISQVLEKKRNSSRQSSGQTRKLYSHVRSLLKQLEKTMSPVIFLVIVDFLVGLLAVLTDFIYLLKADTLRIFVLGCTLNVGWIACLCLLLPLSAEAAQDGCQRLRKRVAVEREALRTLKDLGEFLRDSKRLKSDDMFLTLSAWGVFGLNRGLILPALTSIITYGVILAQMQVE